MRKLICLIWIIIFCFITTNVSAECFVVIKNGNIRIGPGTKYGIAGKAKFGVSYSIRWKENINIKTIGDWVSFDSYGKFINKNKTRTAWIKFSGKSPKAGDVVWLTVDPSAPTFIKGEIKSYTGYAYNVENSLRLHEVLYYPEEYKKLYIHKSLVRLFKSDRECYDYAAKIRSQRATRIRNNKIKKYGWSNHINQIVTNRQIQLGMTKKQIKMSWGNPEDINRTVGVWGVHEQWCYGSGYYLYFENGILTSWQD